MARGASTKRAIAKITARTQLWDACNCSHSKSLLPASFISPDLMFLMLQNCAASWQEDVESKFMPSFPLQTIVTVERNSPYVRSCSQVTGVLLTTTIAVPVGTGMIAVTVRRMNATLTTVTVSTISSSHLLVWVGVRS